MTASNQQQDLSNIAGGQRRHAVILVNDLAPGANKLNWVEACSRGFGPGVDVSLVRVSGFEAVRREASAAADAGAWVVISVGGDGTCNAIINGIGARPTQVCVVPAGTSNGLAYVLGYGMNIANIMASLGQYIPIEIDAMRVNGYLCSGLAAAGWMSDAALSFNQFRARGKFWRVIGKLLGTSIYTSFFLWGLMRPDKLGSPLHISYVDAQDKSKRELDIDIQNLMLLGPPVLDNGRYKLHPQADMSDGKMELLLIRRTSRAGLFKALSGMQDGSHLKLPQVTSIQAERFELVFERKTRVSVEAEGIPYSDKYIIDIAPTPLRFLAPPGTRPGTRRLYGPA
jgi:diacylglycerol kinase (ATP)